MEPTDIELMLQARDGNTGAFHRLVQRYRDPLRRFFAALLPDSSEADDCVQETFLRLWLNRKNYQPTGKFSSYLFQFGKNHLLNTRKKYRARPMQMTMGTEAEQQFVVCEQPEWIMQRQARDARIRAAIAELPEHYRIVIEMSHFQEMKYSEIARTLDIPLGTVKSRMAEAVRCLRLALQERED